MSAIPGGIWKVTIHELNRNIQQIGREGNTERIADIVMNHAAATAVSAAASGVCPARATPVGAADGLPEQLSACLAVSDRADTIRMDAWRKSLAFCARRDDATLVDARLAGDQPQERLKTLTAPALTLLPDALLELMLTGVLTDALAAELERLALVLPDMPGNMGCYERMLYLALLGGSRVDLLARRVAVDQRCAELMMEYQCVLINGCCFPWWISRRPPSGRRFRRAIPRADGHGVFPAADAALTLAVRACRHHGAVALQAHGEPRAGADRHDVFQPLTLHWPLALSPAATTVPSARTATVCQVPDEMLCQSCRVAEAGLRWRTRRPRRR